MKVKVIGSGSMWNEYNSACYLVDDNIMVDFPNGTCKYLYRNGIYPYQIDNVLLTHFHGDHYFDMPFYLLNKSKNKKFNVNIYCSEDGENKINEIGNLAFPNSFMDAMNDLNVKFNFQDEFSINDYKINKYLVDHGRMKPAYGYIFNKEGISFGFTGDTCLCEKVEYLASQCKYLFIDCMFEIGTKKHMGIDNLIVLIEKYPECTYVVSHLENATRNKLIESKLKNVIVPNDYDEIIINN